MTLFVGIDGGGTKTHALFFNTTTGKTLAVEGNASRTSSVGWQASLEVVQELIRDGLNQMGAITEQISGLSACMSGIDLPEQSSRMAEALSQQFSVKCIEVVNDALAALSAGTLGQPGIVLIGGTGSIALGEDQRGRIARAGGYGSLIGDEGSGYDIGRRGLMAAVQHVEGRGPKTILWDKISEVYQIQHPSQLIPTIYESNYPIGKIAAVAPLVVEAAEQDATANAILNDAISSYRNLIDSVSTRLDGLAGKQVILGGGLFTNDGVIVERLIAACDSYEFQILRNKPVYGAVLRALRLGKDGDLSDAVSDAFLSLSNLSLDDFGTVV